MKNLQKSLLLFLFMFFLSPVLFAQSGDFSVNFLNGTNIKVPNNQKKEQAMQISILPTSYPDHNPPWTDYFFDSMHTNFWFSIIDTNGVEKDLDSFDVNGNTNYITGYANYWTGDDRVYSWLASGSYQLKVHGYLIVTWGQYLTLEGEEEGSEGPTVIEYTDSYYDFPTKTFNITVEQNDSFIPVLVDQSVGLGESFNDGADIVKAAELDNSFGSDIYSNPNGPAFMQDGANPTVAISDPVNSVSGNFVRPEVDITLKSNQPLRLARVYNSIDTGNSSFGRGWSSVYFSRIEKQDKEVKFYSGDGSSIVFKKEKGKYIAPEGVALTLAKDPDSKKFILSDPRNNSNWMFNKKGNLIKMSATVFASDTSSIELKYDGNNRLKEVRNSSGQWLQFKYNGANLVKLVTDSTGRRISYNYDKNGCLVKVTRPLNQITTYKYNADGFMTRVVEPASRTTEIRYNDEKAVKITDPNGSVTKFVWNEEKDTCKYIKPDGTIQIYKHDENLKLKKHTIKTIDGKTIVKTVIASGPMMIGYVNGDSGSYEFQYDENNKLTAKVDPVGARINYEYAVDNPKLTRVFDPLNNSWLYNWDDKGQLVSATNPKGDSSSFVYDEAGRQIANIDEAGNRIEFVYDPSGSHISEVILADQSKMLFEYFPTGNLKSVIDQLGRKICFEYDELDRITKKTFADNSFVEYTYDEAGNRVMEKDNLGRETKFTFDNNRNVLKVQYPDDSCKSFTYDSNNKVISITDALNRITTVQYDSFSRPVKTTYPDGSFKEFSYDNEGRLVSSSDTLGAVSQHSYDPAGRLITTSEPNGALSQNQYDLKGRKLSETDPLGHIKNFEYDELDRLIEIVFPDNTTEKFKYDKVGNLVKKIDQLGNAWKYAYDRRNRLTKETKPNGAVSKRVYDKADQLVKIVGSLGEETKFSYNLTGNIIQAVDAMGFAWHFNYDNAGRLVSQINPDGSISSFTYDMMDRVISKSDELARVTGFAYDNAGRQVSITDPKGGTTSLVYDDRDSLVEVKSSDNRSLKYTYDSEGRKTGYTDGENRIWRWNYDSVGNMVSEADPSGYIKSYIYDLVGNQTALTNARGQTLAYEFDANNRLVKVADNGSIIATFSYDPAGREIGKFSPGNSVTRAFDSVGNIISESFYPINKVWQYQYDLAGNRIGAISPEGDLINYAYDSLNRMTELSVPSDNTVLSYVYDSLGRLKSKTIPGLASKYAYDKAGQVLGIEHSGNNHRPNLLARKNYEYDLNGNRIKEIDEAGNGVLYAYNNDNWLTKATYPRNSSTSWSYNNAGDVTSIAYDRNHNQTFSYDASGRLVNKGDEICSYDEDGNLTSISSARPDLTTEFEWSAENRLKKVTKKTRCGRLTNETVEEYKYYPADWRMAESTAYTKLGACFKLLPKEFSYVYDLEDESHEYVKTPEILRKPFKFGRFCWKPPVPEHILTRSFVGGPFADDIEISKIDALSFSMMKNAIGSTIGLVNRNGRAIARFDYDPWGNLRWPGRTKADCHNLTDDFRGYLHRFEITRGFGASQHNPWFFAESFSSELTPYLFAGRRFNSLTGNYYNRNRFYSPAVGRFISADPIGFNGDTNLYRYATNNPLGFVDPFGLCTEQLSYEGPDAFDYLAGGAKVGGKALVLSAAVATVILTGPQAGLAAAGARALTGLTAKAMLFGGGGASSRVAAGSIPKAIGSKIGQSGKGTVRLFHGSVDEASQIRLNGFDPNRTPTFVTTSREAAENAIGSQRYLRAGQGLDRGVIESTMSQTEFKTLQRSGGISETRQWPGFNSQNSFPENVLRTKEAIDAFNRGIIK